MLSNDILHKIRQLEIQTKRMLSGSMVGDNTVAQKGFGIEFDQLREYQQGDDIRFIDWRSTARAQKMMVKEYLDDRNRSIHIIVDVSSSLVYGSGLLRKIDISAQVASILALVADYGKDQVAITYIGNDFIDSIQSGRGRAHTHAIMKKMFEYCDQISLDYKPSVDFMKAVHQVMQTQKRASLVCMISDFITEGSYEPFALMRKRHDVIALRVQILDQLSSQVSAGSITPRQFYFQLTHELKYYLGKQFEVNLVDKTDYELIEALQKTSFGREHVHELKKILDNAVMVKFAQEQIDRTMQLKDVAFCKKQVELNEMTLGKD